jgi:hypothetical protein
VDYGRARHDQAPFSAEWDYPSRASRSTALELLHGLFFISFHNDLFFEFVKWRWILMGDEKHRFSYQSAYI